MRARRLAIPVLSAALIALTLVSLAAGRYPIGAGDAYGAIRLKLLSGAATQLSAKQNEVFLVLSQIRLPRVLAAILVGAALATSGAVYQAMFANPLVSPGVLGVLSGAGAGAALGIVVFQSWAATQTLAFTLACAAVALSVAFSLFFPRSGILILLLGGIISSAFFGALSSLLKYVADPEGQLPALVYWLMGTFSTADRDSLIRTGPLITGAVVLMCLQGKTLNVLSQGDEEAASLGLAVRRTRLGLIALSTLASASTVVLAGAISWVGLAVPHIARFIVGPDNRLLLPVTALSGACYLLLTDLLIRTVFSVELPIGVVTALISLPVFVFALLKGKGVSNAR
jgi:iron complex transport system permease protein